jgi:hypothetical protein
VRFRICWLSLVFSQRFFLAFPELPEKRELFLSDWARAPEIVLFLTKPPIANNKHKFKTGCKHKKFQLPPALNTRG